MANVIAQNIGCVVCSEAFRGNSDEMVCAVQCGHVFHVDCLLEWFRRRTTCPYCQEPATADQMVHIFLIEVDTNIDQAPTSSNPANNVANESVDDANDDAIEISDSEE